MNELKAKPIGDWKPRELKFIKTEDGTKPVWSDSDEWINRASNIVSDDELIGSKAWRGLIGFIFVAFLGIPLYLIFIAWLNS